MYFSMSFLFASVSFFAYGLFVFLSPSRMAVSLLVTSVTLLIGYATIVGFFSKKQNRVFWAAFAIAGFGFQHLNHGYPPREFYSMPAVIAAWVMGPADFYSEWHSSDLVANASSKTPLNIPKSKIATNKRNASRKRVRMIANSIATVIIGSCAGFLASFVSHEREEKGTRLINDNE